MEITASAYLNLLWASKGEREMQTNEVEQLKSSLEDQLAAAAAAADAACHS